MKGEGKDPLSQKNRGNSTAIAIIGMSGRFPNAENTDEFWDNICNQKECITFFSDAELEAKGVPREELENPNYVKSGGWLKAPLSFDAEFFKYTPREATMMDPQHRLFMTCCWEALECAGYNPDVYRGRIGVFGGVSSNLYFLDNIIANKQKVDLDPIRFLETFIASDSNYLTTKVSYKFNLTGPSATIQTACSTSFAALNYGCKSLWNDECEMCLVGAFTVRFPHRVGYFYEENGIVSPDGHCRTFDDNARGTVFTNGGGVVLLKKLEAAIDEGDNILAVMRGIGINNDGNNKMSYTASSIEGQVKTIKQSIRMAQIDPSQVEYIECHGTGTKLGDPIEVQALCHGYNFFEKSDGKRCCHLGSVKANIGHLDVAAGMGGLIKVIYCLNENKIPGVINFETPNKKFTFNPDIVKINTKLVDWRTTNNKRYAALNGLGVGGTNVHLVLEEPPRPPRIDQSHKWNAILLSAIREADLSIIKHNFLEYLKKSRNKALFDIAYTYKVGRRHHVHRKAFLLNNLSSITEGRSSLEAFTVKPVLSKINAFIFEFLPYDKDLQAIAKLYFSNSLFKHHIDSISGTLAPLLRLDRDRIENNLLSNQAVEKEASVDHQFKLQEFALKYATAKLLLDCGISPAHYVGEPMDRVLTLLLMKKISLEKALLLVLRHTPLINICEQSAVDVDDAILELIPFSTPQMYYNDARECASIKAKADVLKLNIGNTPNPNRDSCVTIDVLFQNRNLSAQYNMERTLTEIWLAGYAVDWTGFYSQERRRRVVLPNYPFSKSAFSYSEQNNVPLCESNPKTQDNVYYQFDWVPMENQQGKGDFEKRNWLFIQDESAAQIDYESAIKNGIQPTVILYGSEYKEKEDQVTINPENSKQFIKALSYFKDKRQIVFDKILVMASSNGCSDLSNFETFLHCYLKKYVYTSLSLIKTISQLFVSARPSIYFVTKNAQQVLQNESPDGFLHNILCGISRVLAVENSSIFGGCIDIDENEIAQGYPTLFRELLSGAKGEIAIRKGTRYRLEISPIENQTYCDSLIIDEKAAYIVAGGAGAIGRRFIQYLREFGIRNIVVLGRQTKRDVVGSDQIKGVEHINCDITKAENVHKTFDYIYKKYSRIKGIFNLAGVLDDGLLVNQTKEKFFNVLYPKVLGTYNLHQQSLRFDLHYFITFSSINTVLSPEGQANYVAANCAMDAIVRYRRSMRMPGITINWGPWDTGMARGFKKHYESIGISVLTADEQRMNIEFALRSNIPQIGIVDIDWRKYHQTVGFTESISTMSVTKNLCCDRDTRNKIATDQSTFFSSIAPLSRNEQTARIRKMIKAQLSQMLFISEENLEDGVGFEEIGLDSLLAVKFAQILKKVMGTLIPSTVIYDYPTVDEMTKYILDEFFPLNENRTLNSNSGDFDIDSISLDNLLEMDNAEAEKLLKQLR